MRLARPGALAAAWAWAIAVSVLSFVLLWFLLSSPAEELERYPAGRMVLDREGRILRVYPSTLGEFRFPVALEEMSPWLAKAAVAVEDRRFAVHPGIDPVATLRALWQNAARGCIHSGASTIPQQVARMLHGRPRTLLSKTVEAFQALQLEDQLTKREILEAYLNLIPCGGNLRGVEAASLRYFGKRACHVSLGEAALIVGLAQSPSRLRPDRHVDRALERQRLVLVALERMGDITTEERERAAAQGPRVCAGTWPFAAPHFADLARARAGESGRARAALLRTGLERRVQEAAEGRLAVFFAGDTAGRRRLSGAVAVLEVETGAVRALVGSPDFFDRERCGPVNGALRRRSPGSALKPFTYALAYARGIVGPDTRLSDVPQGGSSFEPENFDGACRGLVRASEALSLSLNVPAARLQERLGTGALLGALRDLGLETLGRTPSDYGLTLTLGGGEVTLLDMTNAYAALVRLGEHRPWTLVEPPGGAPAQSSRRVISPGACRLVLESLSTEDHLRQALPGRVPGTGAWLGYKTGTSYGCRDAWAVAFTRVHVVGVWIGDPTGKPHPDLVGLRAAAPVALDLAAELAAMTGRDRSADIAPGPDDLIVERSICSLTGLPAGKHCPRPASGRFPAGAPVPEVCGVHREILVDSSSGRELCRACAGGRELSRRVVEAWPSEVGVWLERHGGCASGRPPHSPDCPALGRGGLLERLRILSPAEGSEYRFLGAAPFEQRVLLSAAARADAVLHWFVDGELVAKARAGAGADWPLRRGSHRIRCVDDLGRAAVVRIEVR